MHLGQDFGREGFVDLVEVARAAGFFDAGFFCLGHFVDVPVHGVLEGGKQGGQLKKKKKGGEKYGEEEGSRALGNVGRRGFVGV